MTFSPLVEATIHTWRAIIAVEIIVCMLCRASLEKFSKELRQLEHPHLFSLQHIIRLKIDICCGVYCSSCFSGRSILQHLGIEAKDSCMKVHPVYLLQQS